MRQTKRTPMSRPSCQTGSQVLVRERRLLDRLSPLTAEDNDFYRMHFAAIGDNANATGLRSTALGEDANATHSDSTAIGSDAFTTRANQVVLGTASETYTLPGISSAASSAAQSGPLGLVTSDAGGNLSYDPGLYKQIGQNEDDIRDNKEGIAMAMALDAPYVPPNSTFAMSGRYGNFEGSSAVSLSGAFRVSPNVQLDAGLAYGVSHSNLGGTVGFTANW